MYIYMNTSYIFSSFEKKIIKRWISQWNSIWNYLFNDIDFKTFAKFLLKNSEIVLKFSFDKEFHLFIYLYKYMKEEVLQSIIFHKEKLKNVCNYMKVYINQGNLLFGWIAFEEIENFEMFIFERIFEKIHLEHKLYDS